MYFLSFFSDDFYNLFIKCIYPIYPLSLVFWNFNMPCPGRDLSSSFEPLLRGSLFNLKTYVFFSSGMLSYTISSIISLFFFSLLSLSRTLVNVMLASWFDLSKFLSYFSNFSSFYALGKNLEFIFPSYHCTF